MFNDSWNAMRFPIETSVYAVDKDRHPRVGMTAMEMTNCQECNKVEISANGKSVWAMVYNAFGQDAPRGNSIRVSSAVAKKLGVKQEDVILITNGDSAHPAAHVEHMAGATRANRVIQC